MWKLIPILLIAQLCMSCGEDLCVGSDYTLRQGICIFDSRDLMDKEVLEETIDILEAMVKGRFGYSIRDMREYYDNTSVEFMKEDEVKHHIYEHDGLKDSIGITYSHLNSSLEYEFEIIANYNNCITFSSFHHEVLHVIYFCTQWN